MKAVDRFWAKVNRGDSCWEWIACKTNDGYGRVSWGGKVEGAHRVSWEIQNGPVPLGKLVCHHCDNPSCVRPDHLFIGTHRDNRHDSQLKGRAHTFGNQGDPEIARRAWRLLSERGWGVRRIAGHLGIGVGEASRILSGESWAVVKEEMLTGTRPGD